MASYKICPDCGASTPKPTSEFYRNRSSKDGFSVYCKKHQNQRVSASRRNNPHSTRKSTKKWKAKNPDKVKAQKKRRLKRPNGKQSRNKMSKRRREAGILSGYHWQIILDEFGQRCVYCGRDEDITQDHYVCIAKGGLTEVNNIVPACRICNAKKNSHDALEFLIQSGLDEIDAVALVADIEQRLASLAAENESVPF